MTLALWINLALFLFIWVWCCATPSPLEYGSPVEHRYAWRRHHRYTLAVLGVMAAQVLFF